MLTICHIVEEIDMVGIGCQSDSGRRPSIHQRPYDLIGIGTCCVSLTLAGQLQLHVLTGSGGRVVAVNIEGNGGTSLQGLTEVHPETGPAFTAVACLQSIAAAVCGSGYTCLSISHSCEGDIASGISLSDKQFLLSNLVQILL